MSATEYNTTHVGLTPAEVVDWLDSWGDMPKVQAYLASGNPEWGIIVRVQQTADVFDDFLLYIPHLQPGVIDPRNLRITLVTGNPVVESVNKAPYVSPDDVGFWEQFQRQLKDTLGDAGDILKWGAIAVLALVALQVLRK